MKAIVPEICWHNRLPILALDIAPGNDDSYKVATGGNDCKVYIWQVQDLTIRIRAGLRRHQKSVGAVRFSSQNFLASGDDDGYIYLWKIQDLHEPSANSFLNDDGFEDSETWQHYKVLRGHIEDISDLAWSKDGKFLLSGSVDNSAILWDTLKGTKIWFSDPFNGYVQGVVIDPHLKFFAAMSSDRTMRIYNFEDKKMLAAIRRMEILGKYKAFFCDDTIQTFCRRIEYSPDGQFLLAPTARMTDKGPQQQQQKPQNIFLVFKRKVFKEPFLYYPTREVALCARFSPVVYKLRKSDKNLWNIPYRLIFAIATSRSVIIYDSQQATPIGYVSQIHLARLTDISWSSDGLMLMVSSYDGYVSIITFDKNEIGEVYTETLLDPIQEVPPQQPSPPPPPKIPETPTIRKFLIKRC